MKKNQISNLQFSTNSVGTDNIAQWELKEWSAIVGEKGINPSLRPEWLSIAASSHKLNCALAKCKLGDPDQITYIPYFLSTERHLGVRLRVFNILSNIASYHNQLVSRGDIWEALNSLFHVADAENTYVVRLLGVVDDSELADAITRQQVSDRFHVFTIPGETSPYLPLAGSFEELLASKPKKFRYKARKRREQLESNTDLQMRWYKSADECNDLMNAIELIEKSSWKYEAGHAIHTRAAETRYYEMLLPFLGKRGSLMANILWSEGNPIAYNICCHWGSWIGQLKTSFDMRYQSISPGMTVIDSAIERAHDSDATEFDFLGDADLHKLGWSKLVRSHTDYFLYSKRSLKSRLVSLVKRLHSRK